MGEQGHISQPGIELVAERSTEETFVDDLVPRHHPGRLAVPLRQGMLELELGPGPGVQPPEAPFAAT